MKFPRRRKKEASEFSPLRAGFNVSYHYSRLFTYKVTNQLAGVVPPIPAMSLNLKDLDVKYSEIRT